MHEGKNFQMLLEIWKCWIKRQKASREFHEMMWHLLIGHLTPISHVFCQGQIVKLLEVKALHAHDDFGMK